MAAAIQFLKVTHPGLRINATTSWQASTTLTLGDDNTGSRLVRLIAEPVPSSGASTCIFVRVGAQSLTADTTCLAVTSNEGVILDVRGFTYVNVLALTSTANLNVTPIENGP